MGSTILTRNADVDVKDVTLVLDTSAYATGDVLAVPQEITGAFRAAGDTLGLITVIAIDTDDNAQSFDLVFFNEDVTLGTINSAVSISDADVAKFIGKVTIETTDYVDLVNSQVAQKSLLNLPLKAKSDSTSLWVGAILRSGSPTYTASGIKLKLGFV